MKITEPKISPTGKEILAFLISRGGSSSVGVIGANRSTTIRHLRLLESAGLIECLSPPEKYKTKPDALGIEGHSLSCGSWRVIDSKKAADSGTRIPEPPPTLSRA